MIAAAFRPQVSVVIPCFNEQENIRAICAAVTDELERHAKSHEIIVIDNCSTDDTRDIVRDLCSGDPRIRAIFNNRNYGQMRSPTYGIYQAGGEAVIGMCADFQDPPELIGEFIRKWRDGAQVVLGQRRSERTSVPLRIARDLGYAFLRRYGDYPVVPGATGFGLYDRKVVDALAQWNEPEPFFRGMLVESGFRLDLVAFDRPERAAGKTKNDSSALFSFALSGLAGSAKALLRLPIVLAFYSLMITMLLAVSAIVAIVLDGPAWPLFGVTLGFAMFSVLLLFLGLIGEQLRMQTERSRNVPLVIEEERINFPENHLARTAHSLVVWQ